MDVVFHDGTEIDLGEAVAETLALASTPIRARPTPTRCSRRPGVKSEEEAGPFAALAGLRDRLKR